MDKKLPKTVIKVTSVPPSMRYDDFAIECRRTRSQIDKAVRDGELNWGEANGLKSVVIDDLSESYKEKCLALDKFQRTKKQVNGS